MRASLSPWVRMKLRKDCTNRLVLAELFWGCRYQDRVPLNIDVVLWEIIMIQISKEDVTVLEFEGDLVVLPF